MKFGYYIIFIILIGGCNPSPAPKTKEETPREVPANNLPESSTEAPYPERLRLLLKDSTLIHHFRFDEDGLRMYPDSLAKANDESEYHIYPEEYVYFADLSHRLTPDSLLSTYLEKGTNKWADLILKRSTNKAVFKYGVNPEKPLQGLRVALDPGHLAHNLKMAEIEGKYVKMLASKATNGKKITFFEAAHNLATAHFLKEKLEVLGASVLMTRKALNDYPMGMSFNKWRKTEATSGLEKALANQYIDSTRAELVRKGKVTDKQHFTWVYNQLDLRKRAEAINAWQPDLTVIIHYNITQAAWKDRTRRGFFPAAKDNFCMTFTPGSFMRGELSRPIDRISFARLLLSNDINQSVALSSRVCDEFHSMLKIPYVTSESPTSYIERACVDTKKPGVYARNLTLSRLIASPLVYGESLCQEYPKEALALEKTPLKVAGMRTSKRVEQVADAYLEGIVKWVKKDQ